MSRRYDEVVDQLRRAYDGAVEERARKPLEPWKHAERVRFLKMLRGERRGSLLEIGAGTGDHGRFFADAGLVVVCTDLSAAMVAHCRARGLVAVQQDVLDIDLGRSFDAAFAMNCLLHVPREDLPAAFSTIRSALTADGLFYLGQYGGIDRDGDFVDDWYRPKRYFSWLTDDDLLAMVGRHFLIESFRPIDVGSDDGSHFQSLVLRSPPPT